MGQGWGMEVGAMGLAILLGSVTGAWSWRSQTRRMRWRSVLFDKSPAGMTEQRFKRHRRVRATMRRAIMTALWGAAGASAGLALAWLWR